MQKWKVDQDGVRLQDFLRSKLPKEYSNKEIKRLIDYNSCLVNNKAERFASKKLSAGDLVQFDTAQLGTKWERPHFDPARIIFEDEALLIYNKPPGVNSDEKGIIELLKPHGEYILTHRLDKETSGILILAKSAKIEENITDQFRQRLVHKTYLALVDGCPKDYEGNITNYLGKIGSFHGQTIYGKVSPEKGYEAKTKWRLKKASKNAALVECYPETGRTHQIRVHLASLGHPILGDHQYGKQFRSNYRPPRVLLHASSISFTHPESGKKVSYEAHLPQDFLNIMKILW